MFRVNSLGYSHLEQEKKTITRSLAAPPCSFYSHENSYSKTITRHKSLLVEASCHLCLFLKYYSHDFSYCISVLPSCSPHAQNHADFFSCLLCSIWCSWDSFRHVTTVYSPLLLVNVHYTITSLSMFNGHVVFSSFVLWQFVKYLCSYFLVDSTHLLSIYQKVNL